jgi:DNA-binding response OmpR family regulator
MPRIICIDSKADRAEEPVKILRSAGYEVMLAISPEVGMALLRLFPPDIVLLDSELSDKLGPQLRQVCPGVPVVLTGNGPLSVEELRWLAGHQRVATQAEDARHLPH